MPTKIEFDNLLDKLKSERDEIMLKLHLASMEAKEEFEAAEKNWDSIKINLISKILQLGEANIPGEAQ